MLSSKVLFKKCRLLPAVYGESLNVRLKGAPGVFTANGIIQTDSIVRKPLTWVATVDIRVAPRTTDGVATFSASSTATLPSGGVGGRTSASSEAQASRQQSASTAAMRVPILYICLVPFNTFAIFRLFDNA